MTSLLEAYREKASEFERVRREVEKVRREAIDELLRQRKEINAQLRQLGYEGPAQDAAVREHRVTVIADQPDDRSESVSDNAPHSVVLLENGHRRRRFKGARTFDVAYCSICELRGHDLRAHRGQQHKRAFSETELRTKGLAAESS
ncbi:MAG: hypothetical protein ACRENP_10945 [Longimicrobiales bacterium]